MVGFCDNSTFASISFNVGGWLGARKKEPQLARLPKFEWLGLTWSYFQNLATRLLSNAVWSDNSCSMFLYSLRHLKKLYEHVQHTANYCVQHWKPTILQCYPSRNAKIIKPGLTPDGAIFKISPPDFFPTQCEAITAARCSSTPYAILKNCMNTYSIRRTIVFIVFSIENLQFCSVNQVAMQKL